nr:MAG TPA: hypothetical protein [Caudoviricetes sp.]
MLLLFLRDYFFHLLESFCFKVFNKTFNKKIMLKC